MYFKKERIPEMFKRLKGQRGFTLIELMIVIAVIAILATVLIPRSGLVQETAKEAGIEANALQIEATVNGMIHRYPVSKVADFRTALKGKIGAKLTNPITGSTTVQHDESTQIIALTDASVIVTDREAPVSAAAGKGVVWVQILNDSGTTVNITPYDAAGNKLETTIVKRVN